MQRCLMMLVLLSMSCSSGEYERIMGPACQVSDGASGVVIQSGKEGSLVLTCNHVVASVRRRGLDLTVESGDDEVRVGGPAEVVKLDPESDLALLRVRWRAPAVRPGQMPEPLDKVWMVGCPGGCRPLPFRGYVGSVKRKLGPHGPFIAWVGNGAFYGSSGGAILNERLELIGIQARARGLNGHLMQGVGYAVRIDAIRRFLSDVEEVSDEWKQGEGAEAGDGGDEDQAPPEGMEEAEASVERDAAAGAPVL